jgi:trehalose 6-phosphate phosphatase
MVGVRKVASARKGTRTSTRPAPPPLVAGLSALFLDIDGTLLELATAPDRVLVDPYVVKLLPALARSFDGALALITGRTLTDADRLFPDLKVPIAGQHGLVRRALDGSVHAHASAPELDRLRTDLLRFASRHGGLLIEDKGTTLAVHYRLAPHLASHVHRIVRSHVADFGDGLWRLQSGKAMVEIAPSGRDKGTAIQEYMDETPFRGRMPVFVGDDRTDEHGFRAVREMDGWSIKVGTGATAAQYRLRDVGAVRQWLAAALETPPHKGEDVR